MADGKIVIETGLDSSGVEKGLSKIGSIATKGLSVAMGAITGASTALSGMGAAAIKVGTDFEAQMSRVKAISGATGEEFENLRNQAIELGASTAFSASEAAQGMENLAAAGFTTAEIMDAMPGMLSLAAASGEDLASSADIAASTLRGFGLEASEAAHVADVLAENANRTNSSVAETGEAMKYVAPLARAAGLSMEETAAAIGIMANAGIQGSQAGTTLRGALSRLSRPTDAMTTAMEELGVSFYDSNGEMKSLTEQVGMMRKATEGLTDEQRNNYLVTLYGQEALSGMLALINEGEGSLQELTAAYESADGSAQAAAETMQDNLKGAVEELSGAAETLGIVFYDSVSGSLKETAQEATESINAITSAFQNGGLDAAIEAAGDEFANLAVEAAAHAPDMVDTAVDFLDYFAKGISKNKKKLTRAAGDMAETLAGGLVKVLPRELRAPAEEAIDAISKSLNSGGLKSAANTFVRTFETAIDVVGTLADVALPALTAGLDYVGDNLDWIAPLAAGAATAFAAYEVSVTAVGTASRMATAAQTALNAAMNANPAGLLVAGIAGIAVGMALYAANANQASEEQRQFDAEMEELNDKIAQNREGLDQLSESMEKTYTSVESSGANLERLKGKLDEVFDSSGKVKKGNEEVAKSILEDLNGAMGTSYSLTADGFIANNDQVIGSLDEVKQSVDEYIQKLKEKSLSEAASDQYTKAIQEQAEAQNNLRDAQEKYNTALEAYAEAQKKLNESGNYEGYEEAQRQLNETREALVEAAGAAGEAQTSVKGLDDVMDLLANGNIQEAIEAYSQLPMEAQNAGNGISAAMDTIQQALDSQDYTKLTEGFALAAQEIENTGGRIPQSLQFALSKAIGTFNQLTPEAQEAAVSLMREMLQGMEDTVPEFEGAASMSAEEVITAFQEYLVNSGALRDIGVDSMDDLQMGLKDGSEAVEQSAESTADGAVKKMSATLSSGGAGLRTAAMNTAGQIGQGFSEADYSRAIVAVAQACGMTVDEVIRHQPEINAAAAQLASSGAAGFSSVDLSSLFGSDSQAAVMAAYNYLLTGQVQMSSAGSGMAQAAANSYAAAGMPASFGTTAQAAVSAANNALVSGAPQMHASSYQMAAMAGSGLTSARMPAAFSREAAGAVSGLTAQLNAGAGTASSAASLMGTSAYKSLQATNLQGNGQKEGQSFGAGLKTGITAQTGDVRGAATAIGKQAGNALKGTNQKTLGSTEGKNLGTGLKTGITSMNPQARSAAVALGEQAASGLKSKQLRSSGNTEGENLGSGLSGGIRNYTGSVSSVASALGNQAASALSSVNLHGSAYGQGTNFAAGLASGIRAGASSAISAAASLASQALSAAKRVLDINSPSGETEKFGMYFDQGLGRGVDRNKKGALKSVKDLSEEMLEAVDLTAVAERMRSVMDLNMSRITAAYSAPDRRYSAWRAMEGNSQNVHQEINFYQPAQSPVETSRILRREGRRLAYQ